MGIYFNYQSNIGRINPNIKINNQPPIIHFGNSEVSDSFESTAPEKYTTEYMVTKLTNANPNISKILNRAGVPLKINMTVLNNVLETHAKDTQRIAEGIVQNLPAALQQKADLKAIKDSAYLHDIGKVFIPEEIVNKHGKLTDRETDIMHKHSELGYELLKNTNLSPKVLDMIKNHHQNAQKTGYPKVNKQFFANLDLQILTIADKYSALTEQRPYKPPLTREQALTLIRKDVREGKLNPLVFNALTSYTDKIAIMSNGKNFRTTNPLTG